MAIVVMVAAVAALVASHQPTRPGQSGPASQSGSRIASAAALRSQAVSWVITQAGQNVSVACDAVTCAGLVTRGFPASNLTVLQPTAPDPYGGLLVIATADVRSQFGTKLSSVYAPQVIASFGGGSSRIDIRVVASQGPVAFQTSLSADLAARKSSGAQLLRNSRITVAAGARDQLTSGHVDSRLLTTIAFLAGQHPVDVVGFGGAAAGADSSVPLRTAYLAESDAAAHQSSSAYVSALEAVLRAQSPPYVPLSFGTVHQPGGQPVLEIQFPAPSPFGLLGS